MFTGLFFPPPLVNYSYALSNFLLGVYLFTHSIILPPDFLSACYTLGAMETMMRALWSQGACILGRQLSIYNKVQIMLWIKPWKQCHEKTSSLIIFKFLLGL